MSKKHKAVEKAPCAKLVEITPEIAASYLQCNSERQRKISRNTVEKYANDLLNGRWRTNGGPIRFDWDGNLIDGQHRLTAVVETGVSITEFVIWNLDPKAFETIDQGRVRSLGTVIGAGTKEATIARAIVTYETTESVAKAISGSGNYRVTAPMVGEWYLANENLVQTIKSVYNRLRLKTEKLSMVATAVSFRAMQLKGINADRVADDLCTAFTKDATARANIFARRMPYINSKNGKDARIATAKMLLWLAEQYHADKEPGMDVSGRLDLTKYDIQPRLDI